MYNNSRFLPVWQCFWHVSNVRWTRQACVWSVVWRWVKWVQALAVDFYEMNSFFGTIIFFFWKNNFLFKNWMLAELYVIFLFCQIKTVIFRFLVASVFSGHYHRGADTVTVIWAAATWKPVVRCVPQSVCVCDICSYNFVFLMFFSRLFHVIEGENHLKP